MHLQKREPRGNGVLGLEEQAGGRMLYSGSF